MRVVPASVKTENRKQKNRLRELPGGVRTINRINCFNCVHFAITWDVKFPKACKAFGFKTANMPSVTVFQSTGSECIAFTPKQKTTEERHA
jgi:hypothetical protein